LERKSDVNTSDVCQIRYLRDIVIATLPSDLGIKITRKMADNASDQEIRATWLDALAGIQLSETPQVSVSNTPITVDYVISIFPSQLASNEKRKRLDDLLGEARDVGIKNSSGGVAVLVSYVLFNTRFL
jgi:hypothetical protein